MKWLIVSDSHQDIAALKCVAANEQGVDCILHAGDYAKDADCLMDLGVAIYAVHGNCDMYFGLDANEKIFDEVKGGLLLTHGHQYNVKSGMSRLVAEAKQQRVSTVVFGHTHQPLFVNLDGILLLNPGSISVQKSGGHPTYAVLETNSEGDIIRAEIRLLL